MDEDIEKILSIERRNREIFEKLLFSKFPSVVGRQLMLDDHFFHRRDRTSNDVHLFFELDDGNYFHLRAYTRYMFLHPNLVDSGEVYLTGYLKDGIEQTGGEHSLRQDWYESDSDKIREEIILQNPHLFID